MTEDSSLRLKVSAARDDRGQTTEDRIWDCELRISECEFKSEEIGVRRQDSGIRGQRSEVFVRSPFEYRTAEQETAE